MIRPLAFYLDRLDRAYADRPYFVGLKARLLAGFCFLVVFVTPLDVVKLYWIHSPGLGVRLGLNAVMAAAALVSLRLILKGRLELAGNGFALALTLATHAASFATHSYVQPLSVAIQLSSVDFVLLIVAIVFGSRLVAVSVLGMMIAGNVGFYLAVLRHGPISGLSAFDAVTLLRDGLTCLGLVFCLGIILLRMIEAAQVRNEETLRETRSVNENLGRLVAERTRGFELASRRAEEASRAKSEFLANMSHEIRTPLNGIVASADLLVRRADLSPEAAGHARLISDSGDLLLKLLGDILDLSKIEAGQLELEKHRFALESTVANTVSLIANKAVLGSVPLGVSVLPELPKYFDGDSYRLRQVLLNLLSNAIKFTPAGGEVRVTVGSEDPAAKPVLVRFEVRDKGIGMDAAAIARIFDRFTQADSSTTRRYGGTGLGLAISSRIVEMMGGQLGVESVPGKGSAFFFTIPLQPAEAAPESPAALERLANDLDLHVLVAEDNAVNHEILGAQLALLGCKSSVLVNGEEALDWLRRSPPPDVILMDCHMPKLDGWETTRAIRSWKGDADPGLRRIAEIPVIALTAAALPEERERCIEAGMTAFLTKPVKLADLHRALEPFAGSGSRRSPAAENQRDHEADQK